jgi:hypothetical protein
MLTGDRTSRTYVALALVLVGAFLAKSFAASSQKSAAFDEPGHIAAGLYYLATGSFYLNPQHPPLLKELSGLSLWLAGVRWPATLETEQWAHGAPHPPLVEFSIGYAIITSNGPNRVMFWARLPFILLAAIAGWLIFIWGRELLGAPAGLGALFLYAFDANIMAHSSLVTTDAGMSALTVLFLYALWRYVQRPSAWRLVACGAALGAALSSKFSAVALLPIGGLLLLAGMWPRIESAERVAEAPPNSVCPCGSGRRYKRCHGAPDGQKPAGNFWSNAAVAARRSAIPFLGMLALAAAAIEVIYLFSNGPALYLAGMRLVNADHAPDYRYYLHGAAGVRSGWYFAVAYLVKEPLAGIALAAMGSVLLIRKTAVPLLRKLFVLLPAGLLFLAYTIGADPVGIRYIIPVLPFAFLAGGAALGALAQSRSIAARTAAAVLCVWIVVESAGIFPDHMSSFNEMACAENPSRIGMDGGSRCGPLWLDDSNVDWGEGLKQLRIWLVAHPAAEPVRLYYFGSQPPKTYGIDSVSRDIRELLDVPSPGVYVVSTNYVARGPAFGATWLHDMMPTAIVGHAFYIYDVPRKAGI